MLSDEVEFTAEICRVLEVSLVIQQCYTEKKLASIPADTTTGAALLENNEASTKLTTANGVTFTSRSARLSSHSRYSTLDQ